MLSYRKPLLKKSLVIFLSAAFFPAMASKTLFTITPITAAPAEILKGKEVIATYRITNNTPSSTNDLAALPSDVSQILGSGYCTSPLNLARNASCVLKLKISGAVSSGKTRVPTVCMDPKVKDYCSQPSANNAIVVKVVNDSTTDMPALQAPANVDLTPGATAYVEVKNLSFSQLAENINMTVPQPTAGEIDNIDASNCSAVLPQASCIIRIRAKDSASALNDPQIATIQGANTQSVESEIDLPTVVTISDVFFNAPGQQNLNIHNVSNSLTIDVTSAHVQAGLLSGVTPVSASIPAACQSLAPGASCQIPFTATQQAYGSGTIKVSYISDGAGKSIVSHIGVADTSVAVNNSHEIRLDAKQAGRSITLENTGAFAWQSPHLALQALGNTSMDATDCTAAGLAPGATCQIIFTTIGAALGSNTLLAETGKNIQSTQTNVVIKGGLVVEPDVSVAHQHIQYKAFKFENLTLASADTATLSSVNMSAAITSLVHWCQPGDAACQFKSTCDLVSPIAQGGACTLWFKAQTSQHELGATAGTISINAHESNPQRSVTKSLHINYENNLYVGGDFTKISGVTVNRIARWNGSAWSALTSGAAVGVSNRVAALGLYKGDLYLGGSFTSAGASVANRIASWNGVTMSPLVAGSYNGVGSNVWSLATYANKLYVGGQFSNVGGIAAADRIVAWDGASWSALASNLNNSVFAMTVYDNKLIIGGQFSNAGGIGQADRIVAWNG